MKLYPAIDIRDGNCVRLYQGDYGRETIDGCNPADQAAAFVAEGAAWIHVVDLDAARSGDQKNLASIAAVADRVDVPLQVGGGVRNEAAAEHLFSLGVERVVIGTAALENPGLVASVAANHRVAVGLDGHSGEVAVHGWKESSGRTVFDVAADFAEVGVDAFIVTVISRDGTLEGPDIAGLREMVASTDVTVIASGGVGEVGHVSALAGLEVKGRSLGGVICGRALYEGTMDLAAAISAVGGATS